MSYGLLGGYVLSTSNDYQVLLAMQALTLVVLWFWARHRGAHLWAALLAASLAVRLGFVAAVRPETNKAAKFRRWDALVSTVGYAVTLGYLMRSVSFRRYVELTTIGIPTAIAGSMALLGDSEYDLGEYAKLAKEAYSTHTLRDEITDTRVLIRGNVVAFAGTDSSTNVKTDLKVSDVAFPACGNPKTRVHAGFFKAWTSVRDRVFASVEKSESVVFTGHSLGGALATLAALDWTCTTRKPADVVTFGSPQVGDELFVDAFDARIRRSTRVVTPLDPVPKSLSTQFPHVKGVYHVPTLSPNPHSMKAYVDACSKPSALRLLLILLPLVAVLILEQEISRRKHLRQLKS